MLKSTSLPLLVSSTRHGGGCEGSGGTIIRLLVPRHSNKCSPPKRFFTPSRPSSFSSTPYVPPVRREVTPKERAALRAARKERATATMQAIQSGGGTAAAADAAATAKDAGSSPSSSILSYGRINANRFIWPLAIGIPTALIVWGMNDENSPPAKLSKAVGLTSWLEGIVENYALPSHDRLLPSWQDMPNVPHDIPVPHTLVLDLEDTLVSATWDRKHGWRYAKRPGVDKFLHDLAQYYEIVLYSPSIEGVADPVVDKIDKNGCILHRLYREKTHYINGIHVKDLNRLNRNVKRIVAVDDDPAALQLNPENLIRVKPYTDPTDREDDTLARITPFLIEIAREGYDDIPALLRQFQGMDAHEIAEEYERRIEQVKIDRYERSRRAFGGLASVVGQRAVNRNLPEPELEAVPEWQTGAPQQLTAKDIAGAAPPSAASETGMMGWLNKRNKEKQEDQMRKMEYWNEVMMKKQQEKKEREERNREREERRSRGLA